MQTYLYSKEDDIEVSFSPSRREGLVIKSEIKNLTFDLSIVKFEKLNNFIEKVAEREVFLGKYLVDKTFLSSKIEESVNSETRFEIHLKLYDIHLNSRYFYFDLGGNWTGGGLFFVRDLKE